MANALASVTTDFAMPAKWRKGRAQPNSNSRNGSTKKISPRDVFLSTPLRLRYTARQSTDGDHG
jgi:hypothetical protein